MKDLSLCMIVKNEEQTLSRCLNSCYSLFDEIIIVDTGSTDNTIEIAKKFTDNVLEFEWCDDFSKARNYAILNSNCEYFMWLDADDVINEENLKKLKELKKKITNEDFVMLKYDISFDKNNKPTFSYFRERIIRNSKLNLFKGRVHEAIELHGNIIYEDISIQHKKVQQNTTGRNLKIYEKMKAEKIKFSPREEFYYGRELMYNNKTSEAIIVFKNFLKNKEGFIENKIEACKNLSTCYLTQKDYLKAKEVLFNSFAYDLPRSEILCNLGYIFMEEKDYKSAIYYFNLATNTQPNIKSGAFIQQDYYDYIPYLEMCVCYYNLGDYKKALYYNNLAKNIKPYEEIPLKNEEFLIELLTKNK